MALERGIEQKLFTLIGSDDEPTKSPVPYPEPLPINLPRSLLEMDESLPTTALDQLRGQIDEQTENDHRRKSSFKQGNLYPRRLLIVDYVSTDDGIEQNDEFGYVNNA